MNPLPLAVVLLVVGLGALIYLGVILLGALQ